MSAQKGTSAQKGPTSAQKKKKPGKPAAQPAPAQVADQLRAGMPAQDSVSKVVDFVSPQGAKYQIIKTTEADAYDQLPPPDKKREKK